MQWEARDKAGRSDIHRQASAGFMKATPAGEAKVQINAVIVGWPFSIGPSNLPTCSNSPLSQSGKP